MLVEVSHTIFVGIMAWNDEYCVFAIETFPLIFVYGDILWLPNLQDLFLVYRSFLVYVMATVPSERFFADHGSFFLFTFLLSPFLNVCSVFMSVLLWFCLVSLFDRTSVFIGYLLPEPFLWKNTNDII